MAPLKQYVQRTIHHWGWDLHHYDSERSLETYLARLLPELGVNCVLDVGARIGEFGQMLRAIGFKGHILSFEPVAVNFELLRHSSSLDPLWTAYPFALGSEEIQSSINVTQATNFSSFLPPNEFGRESFPGEIYVERRENVSIQRLDIIFEEVTKTIVNPTVYLKMDTQGWDVQVLRGAENCLEKIVAAQSEMSLLSIYEQMPNAREAMAAFEEAGFFASAMYPVSRDLYRRLVEFDCVMVRRPAEVAPLS